MRSSATQSVAGVPLLAFLLVLTCAATRAPAQPGDANCDGALTDADIDALSEQLFADGEPSCPDADVNQDGLVAASDHIALIELLRPTLLGPPITFLGIAGSDGRATTPLGELPDGSIVYYRSSGFGFQVVIEAGVGESGALAGTRVLQHDPDDPTLRPDIQPQVNRPLGDGGRGVCDESGVPAIMPPSFAETQEISDALNDLACRMQVSTLRNIACTQDAFGQVNFLSPATRTQFCLAVDRQFMFPLGDTLFNVQFRDELGNLGRARQLVVRVGSGPMPPTFTPIPPTSTRTPSPTRARTNTATRTGTPTSTITRRPATPTHTLRPGVPTPTRTRTPTGGAVRTSTPTRTPTRTGAPPTRTMPPNSTPTRTRTRTQTPTPTIGVGLGPVVVFLGMTRADDLLVPPEPPVNPNDPNELRVFRRPFGSAFSLVVETRPGASGRPASLSTFEQFGCPALQIQVTRPLGNGTEAVCDILPSDPPGGVAPIDPPRFDEEPGTCDRFNDFSCRFVDGAGAMRGRPCSDEGACIRFDSGDFGCVAPGATSQFCGLISQTEEFPLGDTTVSARVLDTNGNPGPPAQIVVRVEPE